MKHFFRNRVLYIMLLGLQGMLLGLPYRAALVIGAMLGRFAYYILSAERRRSIDNLRAAFSKEKTTREIRTISAELFCNLGRNLVEVLRFPLLKRSAVEKLIDAHGLENVDRAFARGKGVILLASHIGNWELLAAFYSLKGYRLYAVARNVRNPFLNEVLLKLRERVGIKVIDRQTSPRIILKALKANAGVGILPDQDVKNVSGVFVEFLGKEAYTPSAPVALSLASGAPIIPCFLIRQGTKHTLYIENELCLDVSGDKKRDILVNTQKWSRIVEKYVRKYPSQWIWMHKRWKTRSC